MESSLLTGVSGANDTSGITEDFVRVRSATVQLAVRLHPEDTVAQSMPDASPVKWHLAHTTWFFEQFVLQQRQGDARWAQLFNSYYQSMGPQFSRDQRGILTRPSLAEVMDYRKRIDDQVLEMIETGAVEAMLHILQLGLHHERQHQELLLTDVKHLFSLNPLEPTYSDGQPDFARGIATPMIFVEGRSGIVMMGCDETDRNEEGFSYDNERPRHRVILALHALANRPVNNAEYRSFIEDGGYRDARLWMADGWNIVQRENWQRPLYWSQDLDSAFTLRGRQDIDPLAPVTHLSFFEADAYARWAQARLPTEAEWEASAAGQPAHLGNFVESGILSPQAPGHSAHRDALYQMFGDVWEWTASPYVRYPGFKPLPGAAGEYNGKFMNGQWVLRGGSCVTPAQQMRATYRNYFPPTARWQFSGVRLARDL
ncbi:MAG: ergothioneine biosynthesis protein EgtB [Pseudohongiella sp.]|nr:ergothioneine biosynthesis protein EgtB [Pseudohongiella sp.]